MGKKVKRHFSISISYPMLTQCLSDLHLSPAVLKSRSPYSSGEYIAICRHLGLHPTATTKKRLHMMLKRNVEMEDTEHNVSESHVEVLPPCDMSEFSAELHVEASATLKCTLPTVVPAKVEPKIEQVSAAETGMVKPTTGKHSASIRFTVEPNTEKHSAPEASTTVKPNTGNHSAALSLTVKPNTEKHSAPEASTTVKPNTEKHSAPEASRTMKPKTEEHSATGHTPQKKANTHSNPEGDSGYPGNSSHQLSEEHADISKALCGNKSKLCISKDKNERTASKGIYNIHLGSCSIDEKNWALMWTDGELMKRKYGHGLSQAVSAVESGCVIICDRHIPWKDRSHLTVIAHCRHQGCRRFKLVIHVTDLKPMLDVYCDKAERHHGKLAEWRPLNGPYRKSLYEMAELVKPLAMREKMAGQADQVALSQGNAQGIQPCAVFSRLSCEGRGQNDLNTDPFKSVVLMRREQVKRGFQGVQYIWVVQDPLAVYIYCLNRLQLLKKAKANLPNRAGSTGLTFHLDATGSVVRKVCLSDKVVYYYALVFKFKAPEQEHIIQLAEFVSSNHDAVSISNWLSSFKNFAAANGVSLGGHFIVLDTSYAELNAVVLALNGMALFLFLQLLHSILTKSPEKWVVQMFPRFVIPHLDYSHFKKNIAQSIKSHYYPSSRVQNDGLSCSSNGTMQDKENESTKAASQPSTSDGTPEDKENKSSKAASQSCSSDRTEQDKASKSSNAASGSTANIVRDTVTSFKADVSRQKKENNLTKQEYKSVKLILMDIFTLIVHTSSYCEMKAIFSHVFTLLLFSVVCPALEDSKKKLVEFCGESPDVKKQNSSLPSKKKGTTGEKKKADPPIFFNVEDDKIKYKGNFFYQDFEKMFSDIIKSHADFLSKNKNSKLEKNIFFNPSFAIYILTYYTHIIPLWTALLLPKDVRLNNGLVENFFNILKNIFMDGRKNIRIDRFLIKSNDHVLAVKRQVDNNVPDRRPRQKSGSKRKRQLGKQSKLKARERRTRSRLPAGKIRSRDKRKHVKSVRDTEIGPRPVQSAVAVAVTINKNNNNIPHLRCRKLLP